MKGDNEKQEAEEGRGSNEISGIYITEMNQRKKTNEGKTKR